MNRIKQRRFKHVSLDYFYNFPNIEKTLIEYDGYYFPKQSIFIIDTIHLWEGNGTRLSIEYSSNKEMAYGSIKVSPPKLFL